MKGAAANELDGAVPEEVKEERYARFMEAQQKISAAKLQQKIGKTLDVIIDDVAEGGADARSRGDAPEIDGNVYLRDVGNVQTGDIIKVAIEDADEYDLYGVPLDRKQEETL